MQSSNPVNKSVNVYINQADAEQSLAKLQAAADKVTKAITKGEKAGKDMSKEVAALGNLKNKINELSDVMSGKAAPSIKMMGDHVRNMKREIDKMSSSAEGYGEKVEAWRKANATLQEMKAQVKGVKQELDETANSGFWNRVKSFATGGLIANLMSQALSYGKQLVREAVSWNARLSDSLSDIRKSTGLTTAEVEALNQQLERINTRTADEELRRIAVGLGQIGEAASAENVKNIDKIVVALGDEFGGGAQEITTVLGVLRNNLQDIKTGNYGEDVLHIGNALNVLGAEGLATAPVVTDIASRISGMGQTFGMTSGQILGTAATMQELGINSERGSTAFVKLLQKMTQDTATYGKIAQQTGITQKEFVALVNTDVVAAFMKVAEGARKAGADNTTFGKILKDLDADGSGAGEMLSKLSANADLLQKKITLASGALKDSSSITEEFNTKNNNLAGNVEKLQKAFGRAFEQSALRYGISSAIQWFGELIGVIDRTQMATEALQAQFDLVQKLEHTLLPVVEQYEQLSAKAEQLGDKTKLSKEEQEKMATAIDQIAKATPYAITQVDAYGKAIGVSTTKFREYLRIQQEILKIRNKEAIDTAKEDLKTTNERIKGIEKEISIQESAQKRWANNGWDKVLQRSIDKVNSLKLELMEAQGRVMGLTGQLNELSTGSLFGNSQNNPLARLFKVPDLKSQATQNATKPEPTKPASPYQTDDDKKAAEKERNQERTRKRQADRLLQDFADLQNKIKAKAADLQDTMRLADQEEEAAVHSKYERLKQELEDYLEQYGRKSKEAAKVAGALSGLSATEQAELENLHAEQARKRADKEYEHRLQGLADYYAKERQKESEAFLSGNINLQEHTENIKRLEADEADGRLAIAEAYKDESVKAAKDTDKEIVDSAKKREAELRAIAAGKKAETDAQLELNVLLAKKGSQAELDARKAQVTKHYEDLQAVVARGTAQWLLLEKQKNNELAKLDVQYYTDKIEKYAGYAQMALNVFQQFSDLMSQREQAELNRDKELNDQKKKNLQDRLDKGLISQEAYNAQVAKLDKDQKKKENDLRRKEFNRNKAAQLVQAAINGAMGISSIWAQWAAAPYVAAALTAVAAGVNAVQLGLIASQKYPELAKGGKLEGMLTGASHAQDGIDMIDNQTGKKVGEVEGNEVVLSADTYRRNKRIVDALLHNSQFGHGAALDTSWLYQPGPQVNTAAYSQAIATQATYQRTAGSKPAGSGGYSDSVNTATLINTETMQALRAFTDALNKGLRAHVVWADIDEKNRQMEDLKNAGRINKNT